MRARRMSSHSRVSETLPKDGRCAGSGTFRGNQFARFLPHPCHSVKEFGLAVDIGDVETLERGSRSQACRLTLPIYSRSRAFTLPWATSQCLLRLPERLWVRP